MINKLTLCLKKCINIFFSCHVGGIAAAITTPIDVIKTQIMLANSAVDQNISTVFIHIYKTKGINGYVLFLDRFIIFFFFSPLPLSQLFRVSYPCPKLPLDIISRIIYIHKLSSYHSITSNYLFLSLPHLLSTFISLTVYTVFNFSLLITRLNHLLSILSHIIYYYHHTHASSYISLIDLSYKLFNYYYVYPYGIIYL